MESTKAQLRGIWRAEGQEEHREAEVCMVWKQKAVFRCDTAHILFCDFPPFLSFVTSKISAERSGGTNVLKVQVQEHIITVVHQVSVELNGATLSSISIQRQTVKNQEKKC